MSRKISIPTIVAIRSLAEIESVPWKNMAGRTKELHVFPEDSDFNSFEWRVSVAEVVASGAFSTFENVDRSIVLLDGDGFDMKLDRERSHSLSEPFSPFSFAGECHVDVTLRGSGTLDLNLMVRRGVRAGKLVIVTSAEWAPLPCDTALIYLAKGNAFLSAGSAQENLRPLDFVIFHANRDLPEFRCEPGAVLIAVCVQRKCHSSDAAISDEPLHRSSREHSVKG